MDIFTAVGHESVNVIQIDVRLQNGHKSQMGLDTKTDGMDINHNLTFWRVSVLYQEVRTVTGLKFKRYQIAVPLLVGLLSEERQGRSNSKGIYKNKCIQIPDSLRDLISSILQNYFQLTLQLWLVDYPSLYAHISFN